MKSILKYSVRIILAMLFATSAIAQPEDAPRRPDPERMKELMHKILEHKHQKLRQVLNLDDETARKFFDIYNPVEQEMVKLVAERNAMELKLLKLTQGDYTDADVDPTLAEIERLNELIKARFLALNDNLKPILTPRQRARLAVFEREFNRRVREKIREHRQERRGPRKPPGPPHDHPPKRRGPMDRDHGPR
jgi:Spy/CpxP family protein refolding chaperone